VNRLCNLRNVLVEEFRIPAAKELPRARLRLRRFQVWSGSGEDSQEHSRANRRPRNLHPIQFVVTKELIEFFALVYFVTEAGLASSFF
jgi:hypothetical protein